MRIVCLYVQLYKSIYISCRLWVCVLQNRGTHIRCISFKSVRDSASSSNFAGSFWFKISSEDGRETTEQIEKRTPLSLPCPCFALSFRHFSRYFSSDIHRKICGQSFSTPYRGKLSKLFNFDVVIDVSFILSAVVFLLALTRNQINTKKERRTFS